MNKRGLVSFVQIFILVCSIIAISYIISSEINIISAQDFKFKIGDKVATFSGDSFEQAQSRAFAEAKRVYGNNFDYNDLEYVSSQFEQIPSTTSIPSSATYRNTVSFSGGTMSSLEKVISKDGSVGYRANVGETSRFLKDTEIKELENLGWIDKDGNVIGQSNYFGLFNVQSGTFVSGILSGAQWATGALAFTQFFGLFISDADTVNSASLALSSGAFAYGYLKEWKVTKQLGNWNVGIGAIVAAAVFYFTYKKTETQKVVFTCESWDAPTGGARCEECNKLDLPCSEYQCRSLGQSCQLLNEEGSADAKCVWVNRNDVSYPVITAWNDALLDDYKYTPDKAASPPDSGVKIIYEKSSDGCVGAFTPLTFGIVTDEPSRCKIDFLRKDSYEDMDYYFGGSSLFKYNHTQSMSLPGPETEDGDLVIENDGNYELFVRCQDANGNTNVANFVFKYCVQEGPDTTAPLIVGTNIINGGPIAYNQSSIDLEVYINEPSDCKWSHLDQTYDEMSEEMSCNNRAEDMNAQMVYTCETTLTGLKNSVENYFYFRCKDRITESGGNNTNAESYEFMLKGTVPLVIKSAEPNGTIRDSTDSVKITLEAQTVAGYSDGEAICRYSNSGDADDYIVFYETNSYEHKQDLYLYPGTYTYYIKCEDLGGNSDIAEITFDVESDSTSPMVIRAYHESNSLKLITDEESTCVYDVTDCTYTFDDGLSFSSTDGYNHYADWNTGLDMFIKCADEFGNMPSPDTCSMIVRATSV